MKKGGEYILTESFKIFTTGPMIVPAKITGDPVGGPPDVVRVTIVNPTIRVFKIRLVGEVYDRAQGTVEIVSDCEQTIPRNSFLRRTFIFSAQPGDFLRFYVIGGLDEDAEKLEIAFIGQRSSDQMDEPTMFFRHADLIEVENLRIHPIAEEPDCSSSSSTLSASTHFWGD